MCTFEILVTGVRDWNDSAARRDGALVHAFRPVVFTFRYFRSVATVPTAASAIARESSLATQL